MVANSTPEKKPIDVSSAAAAAAISAAAAILQSVRPLTPAHAKDDASLWESAGQRGRSIARLAREILEAMEEKPSR
jgi:hypothetical protein